MNDANSLKTNALFNVLYKTLNVFFPLIYTTYIARVLLASGVGRVSYAQNIVQYFTMLAALGIPNYGIREIAKAKNDILKAKKVFSELLIINALSTTFCVVAYYAFVNINPYFRDNILLYNICGLHILFGYINVDWFYQGEEEYRYIAIRSFLVKLIAVACIFLFVKDKNDCEIYALIYAFSLGANNIFNIIHLKKYKINIQFFNLKILRHIKPIFVLLSTNVAIELYTMLDTTMLGIICSEEEVGYYTNAIKLVRILIIIVTAMSGVLLPRLSFDAANGDSHNGEKIVNKVFHIMLFMFLPIGLGVFLTADNLIPLLFGRDFLAAVPTLKIASLLIYTLGFSNLFGTQIMLAYGAEKELLFATVIGGLSNIIMNYFLIPLYQQNGAAVASVVSELLVTIMTYFFSRKYIKIKINFHEIAKSIFAVILMSITVMRMQRYIKNPLTNLVLSIGIGCVVYLGVNIIWKNRSLIDLKRSMKH